MDNEKSLNSQNVQVSEEIHTLPQPKKTMKNSLVILLGVAVSVVFISIAVYILQLQDTAKEKTATAQKVYKVGILNGLDFFGGTTDGFKQGMTKLGYIEGENIVYTVIKSPVPVGNEKSIQKFVDEKVDLIVTFPTEASVEAKKVAKDSGIPVLFTNTSLDGVQLVDNVRKPGGNITGVQFPTADNAVQKFEILHELAPKAKTVWVGYLNGYPTIPEELRRLRPAAKNYGVTLIEFPASSMSDIKAEFDRRERSGAIGIDAILNIPEPLTAAPDVYKLMSDFAVKHNLAMGGFLNTSDADGASLFGYTPDPVEVGMQASLLADKIFKGTPAGSIPVVSSENYLTLNYRKANKMGLTINEALLSRAKSIIR